MTNDEIMVAIAKEIKEHANGDKGFEIMMRSLVFSNEDELIVSLYKTYRPEAKLITTKNN